LHKLKSFTEKSNNTPKNKNSHKIKAKINQSQINQSKIKIKMLSQIL